MKMKSFYECPNVCVLNVYITCMFHPIQFEFLLRNDDQSPIFRDYQSYRDGHIYPKDKPMELSFSKREKNCKLS
jgi:hypothetical protein